MLEHSLLLTDLYELSMLEAYAAHGMTETAVFELFVRVLPAQRGFLVGGRSRTSDTVPGGNPVHAGRTGVVGNVSPILAGIP